MKKLKLSTAEKGLIRSVLIVILVQVLIILLFINTWKRSHPIDIADAKKVEVTVDDTYYLSLHRSSRLIIVSDGVEYWIESRIFSGETSAGRLYDTISKGDKLSLIYCERTRLFWGNVNMVYDARTETEVYRSLEVYNRKQENVPIFVIIVFSIIELIFVGGVSFFVWLYNNVIKGFYRKLKKHLTKKKKI